MVAVGSYPDMNSPIPLQSVNWLQRTFSAAVLPSLLGVVLVLVCNVANAGQGRGAIPEELYKGMVKFKLDSGDYFDALTMMDDRYIRDYPVDYTSALHGYGLIADSQAQLKLAVKDKSKLSGEDRFALGEIYYSSGDCINALKAFKGLKKKISLEAKQKWIFYRANCFMRLGSPQRAAKALKELVDGMWAAYAYYNLAMAYAEESHDKTKALGTLWIANSLNKGTDRESLALSDRINLASGALYLQGGKPDLALDFFKKIHLDDLSSAKGLYLNGLAHLELGDFRAATQSWVSTKTYPVINQSVAESALAIPYAYERSGYISQALEAYLEASSGFEAELRNIDKIDKALEKHGASAILMDGNEIKGLEWFLSKGVVKNTTRAAYYTYFVQDEQIHDDIKLYSEIRTLLNSIDYWSSQLAVFETALASKKSNFNESKNSFSPDLVASKIRNYGKLIDNLARNKNMTPDLSNGLKIEAMSQGVKTLEGRLDAVKKKIENGQRMLDEQLAQVAVFKSRLLDEKHRIQAFLKKYDREITKLCRERLVGLRETIVSNFEKAEQGLVHIFQGIAEKKNAKLKKKNGRYQ